MKKYAVIDIGTNSMRLLLAIITENHRDNTFGFVERKKYINTTRIGACVDKNKTISQEGIEKNAEAFYNFVQKAREFGVEEILAIATSAVREAKNKEEFIQAIYQKTGINIKIISGEEEAELGYKGVIMGLEYHCPCAPVIVIDMGGGSTELILGTIHGDVTKTISLDIGAVRMTEKFITTDPVDKEEYKKMKTAIYETIEGYGRDNGTGNHGDWSHGRSFLVRGPVPVVFSETDSGNDPRHSGAYSSCVMHPNDTKRPSPCVPYLTAVGIGGTITTLAALHQELDPYDPEKVHNYKLTLENINDLKEKLLPLTVQQIKRLKGIHPKRADIIIAGITILSIIMDSLNLKEITVSEYDNLEGTLYTSLF